MSEEQSFESQNGEGYEAFIETVERFTGRTRDDIWKEPICEFLEKQEKETGEINVVSCFPVIGRGNVLKGRGISHETIEERFESHLTQ